MGSIRKQGILNTIIIYIGVAIGFISRIIVQPHYMSTSEVGLIGLLTTFSILLTSFLGLGTFSLCVKYFPLFRNPEKRHHGFLGFLLLFPGVGITIGGIIFYFLRDWLLKSYAENSPLFTHYFDWVFPLAVIRTFALTLNVYCYSLHKTSFPSFLNDIWIRIVLIVATIAFGLGWISLDALVIGLAVSFISQLVFLIIYILLIDRPGLKVDWSFAKSIGIPGIFKYAFLLTLTALTALGIKSLDNAMIGSYLGESFSGVFLIGLFIAQFIETPLYSVERIASSKISHAFSINDMNGIKEIYFHSVRILFLFGGYLLVCIVTNIYDFLKLLQHEYSDAAAVTIVLSFATIINMATGVNTPILLNSSKYIWGVIFLSGLLLISVLLNMLLIPKLGIVGAALATGIAGALYNAMKFIYIWKKFDMQPYDLRTLKTILIIAVTLLVGFLMPVGNNHLLAIILRGSVTTILFLGMTMLFNIAPEYSKVVTNLFGKRRG